VRLRGHCIAGRGSASDVVLQSPIASSEHAALSWWRDGWRIRDLGSRNGTRINHVPVVAGDRRALNEGDLIEFGDPTETWLLSDASAPPAFARSDEGAVVEEQRGLLLIPRDSSPELCVYREGDDWLLDGEPGVRQVGHGEALEVQGQRWTLELPAANDELTPTRPIESSIHLDQISLSFIVSRDEETVRVTVDWTGGRIDLPTRAHNYTLLVLARARLQDQASALPEDECGWVASSMLAEMLKVSIEKVNLDIHRARRTLAEHGVLGAVHIVERRPSVRAVRLGVGQISVDAFSDPR